MTVVVCSRVLVASPVMFYLFKTVQYKGVMLLIITINHICVCVQGRSAKYSPQRVGLHHAMCDEDVIQIVKK